MNISNSKGLLQIIPRIYWNRIRSSEMYDFLLFFFDLISESKARAPNIDEKEKGTKNCNEECESNGKLCNVPFRSSSFTD